MEILYTTYIFSCSEVNKRSILFSLRDLCTMASSAYRLETEFQNVQAVANVGIEKLPHTFRLQQIFCQSISPACVNKILNILHNA